MSPKCFKYIVKNPPRPLTEEDIWFQIGHVHEQQKDVSASLNVLTCFDSDTDSGLSMRQPKSHTVAC